MNRPYEVLICGSNYGSSYLAALDRAGSGYRAAALLARGSPRSKQLAEQQSIPLLTRVEHLPGSIDIACAAMCSSASYLIPEISRRGIHVLCEHPQKVRVLDDSLKAAAANNVHFHVNGHFADLEAPALFIERFSSLRGSGGPWFFHVATTDRFLYGAVDVIARGMGGLKGCTVDTVSESPPYRNLNGVIDGIEAIFQVQVSGASGEKLQDGSSGYLVDMRIAAGFVDGILVLESLAGPVTFTDDLSLDSPAAGVREFIGPRESFDRKTIDEQRVAANLAALEQLAEARETGRTPPHQERNFILGVGAVWEELGSRL